jgi:hypothetical protein
VWNTAPINAAKVVNIPLPELITAAPMVDSFNLVTGDTLFFAEGLNMYFPPNCCVTGTGSVPLTSMIRVEVTHLKKKGDFIRYGKPTMSYDYLLQTGGSFNVVLTTQNGIPVNLAPGVMFKIRYLNPAPTNDMKFFYETMWVAGTDSTATWKQGNSQQGSVSTWQKFDTATQTLFKGYEMFSTKLRWINCDFFNDTIQPSTRMNVTLPLNFTNVNTNVYAVFKNKNIVAGLNSETVSKTFFLRKIPIGSEVILVTISKIGSNYYLGKKEDTVTSSNLVTVNPEPKSLPDIINYLNSL